MAMSPSPTATADIVTGGRAQRRGATDDKPAADEMHNVTDSIGHGPSARLIHGRPRRNRRGMDGDVVGSSPVPMTAGTALSPSAAAAASRTGLQGDFDACWLEMKPQDGASLLVNRLIDSLMPGRWSNTTAPPRDGSSYPARSEYARNPPVDEIGESVQNGPAPYGRARGRDHVPEWLKLAVPLLGGIGFVACASNVTTTVAVGSRTARP